MVQYYINIRNNNLFYMEINANINLECLIFAGPCCSHFCICVRTFSNQYLITLRDGQN